MINWKARNTGHISILKAVYTDHISILKAVCCITILKTIPLYGLSFVIEETQSLNTVFTTYFSSIFHGLPRQGRWQVDGYVV